MTGPAVGAEALQGAETDAPVSLLGGLLRAGIALAGLALGTILVWLSFENVDYGAVSLAFSHLNIGFALLAALTYFAGLGVRAIRWRLLVERLAPISGWLVVQALIVGFAANFALPARLGEIFRADIVKETASLRRASVLGTILLERAVDGVTLVAMLLAALAVLRAEGSSSGALPASFLVVAAILFSAAILAIIVLRRVNSSRFGPFRAAVQRLKDGLASLDRRNGWRFVGLSLATTALEVLAFLLALRALGLPADIVAAALVLGAASLSTLLPTAPAFLGSYQFAFVLAFGVLGWRRATAIAAAFLVQASFFVPVMVAGLALAARLYGRIMLRRRRVSRTG